MEVGLVSRELWHQLIQGLFPRCHNSSLCLSIWHKQAHQSHTSERRQKTLYMSNFRGQEAVGVLPVGYKWKTNENSVNFKSYFYHSSENLQRLWTYFSQYITCCKAAAHEAMGCKLLKPFCFAFIVFSACVVSFTPCTKPESKILSNTLNVNQFQCQTTKTSDRLVYQWNRISMCELAFHV